MRLKVVLVLLPLFFLFHNLYGSEFDSLIGDTILNERSYGDSIGYRLFISSVVGENHTVINGPGLLVYYKDNSYLLLLVARNEQEVEVVYDYEYIELDKFFSAEVVLDMFFIHRSTPESVQVWYLYGPNADVENSDYIVKEPDPLSLGIDPSGL